MKLLSGNRSWQLATGVAILSALLYCSWPLGYILNPVAARISLASGLEAVHQPYSWLFISADVLSSLLMLVVAGLLWQLSRQHRRQTWLVAVIVAVVIFGVGTIVDTALPEHCVPGLQVCANFEHDSFLLMHGMFSILASASLFVTLCVLWWRRRSSTLLNGLMLGYILFGAISLLEAILPGKPGNWSQHYYLTLCSLWLAGLPNAVRRQLERTSIDIAAAETHISQHAKDANR